MDRILYITLFVLLSMNTYAQSLRLKFNEYKPKYVPKYDVESTRQMMEVLQQRADAEAEAEKQRTIVKMNKTIRHYNSFEKFPHTIIDGWHRVTVMNNFDFCAERFVYVENNKVSNYCINKEKLYREVEFSSSIKDAKATIRLKYLNGETGELLDIYFIESILDPTYKAKAPF